MIMSDSNVESSSRDSDPQQPTAQRRRGKLWLKILRGVVVVLILLMILAPTIAVMGFVRSIVVGKINDNLNGKVQITNWSIGWTSGIKVEGIRVFDDAGAQILELKHVSTELPLTSAIRGKLPLGKILVDGLNF